MLKIKEQYGLYTVKEHLSVDEERAFCRAADPFLGHDVALYLIKFPEQCSDEHLEVFQQRLNELAALDHPALAPIFDIGQEEGLCYYTSAFYPEGRFTEGLKEPLPEEDGLQVLKLLAESLAYASNKGFEHGLITSDEIYQDENGLPILVNFGVSELQESLYGSEEKPTTPSQIPSLAQKQSFYSLGALFLSIVLVPEKQAVSLVDQVGGLKGLKEKQLITALLGFTQDAITSYDELLRRLTEMIGPQGEEVASAANQSDQEEPPPTASEKEEPQSVSVEEQKQTPVPDDKVRELEAEKNCLKILLQEATSARDQAECMLSQTEQLLTECQQSEEKARLDEKIAWEIVENQPKQRPHPAPWLIAGLLVGAVLAGGAFYFLFNNEVSSDLAKSQRISIQRQSIVNETLKPVNEPVKQPTEAVLSQSQKESPVQPVPVTAPAEEKAIEETVVPASPVSEELLPSESVETAPAGTDQNQMEDVAGAEMVKVLESLQGWAAAWENQDFSTYQTHYSPNYQPEGGRSREEWMMVRLDRLTRPAWIEIELADIEIEPVSSDLVQVRLKQIYRSESYGDQTIKLLKLVREKETWRIRKEQTVEEISGG